MEIGEEIVQKHFSSEGQKASINLIFTANWHNEKLNSVFKQFQISSQQFNILRILKGQYPNPVSVKTIKARMLDRMSDVSRLVERLKEKGLVERKECPNDRRNVDIVISQAGLEKLDSINPIIESNNLLMSNLTDFELKTLNQLLDKIRG